jgi:hypothetical protein
VYSGTPERRLNFHPLKARLSALHVAPPQAMIGIWLIDEHAVDGAAVSSLNPHRRT